MKASKRFLSTRNDRSASVLATTSSESRLGSGTPCLFCRRRAGLSRPQEHRPGSDERADEPRRGGKRPRLRLTHSPQPAALLARTRWAAGSDFRPLSGRATDPGLTPDASLAPHFSAPLLQPSAHNPSEFRLPKRAGGTSQLSSALSLPKLRAICPPAFGNPAKSSRVGSRPRRRNASLPCSDSPSIQSRRCSRARELGPRNLTLNVTKKYPLPFNPKDLFKT